MKKVVNAYKFGSVKDPKKFDGHVVTRTAHYGTGTSQFSETERADYISSVKSQLPETLEKARQALKQAQAGEINFEPSLIEYEERYFKPVLKELNVPIPSNLGFYGAELTQIEWQDNYPKEDWERCKSMAEIACAGLSAISRARSHISLNNYQRALLAVAQAGHNAVTLRTQIMERDYYRGQEKTAGLEKGRPKFTEDQKEHAQRELQRLINCGHSAASAYRVASKKLDIKESTLKAWDRTKEIIIKK